MVHMAQPQKVTFMSDPAPIRNEFGTHGLYSVFDYFPNRVLVVYPQASLASSQSQHESSAPGKLRLPAGNRESLLRTGQEHQINKQKPTNNPEILIIFPQKKRFPRGLMEGGNLDLKCVKQKELFFGETNHGARAEKGETEGKQEISRQIGTPAY